MVGKGDRPGHRLCSVLGGGRSTPLGGQAMVGRTLRAALTVALFASADLAVASPTPIPGDAAPAARVERPSATTTAAVDELLDLSGLKVQLAAISAGIRVQFLGTRGGLSAQDLAVIDRIAARHFRAEMLYAR